MMKCIKCEEIEQVNGFTICREEDRKQDVFTGEYSGRVRVFYTVNTDDCMLDSFKTLAEARRFAKSY